MKRSYEKWFSPALGRDMELLHFGWDGFPVILFPPSKGRFFQYEDCGLVAALGGKLERGELQLFCVDSVDAESWYDEDLHPALRGKRHEAYDAYLRNEVLPYVYDRAGRCDLGVFGCGFGAYHAANFAGRYPDLTTKAVCFSGIYDVRRFTGGHWDDTDYFNSPLLYIANIEGTDLQRMRGVEWVIATGEFDEHVDDNRRFDAMLASKGIPHYTEIWPGISGHEWPTWNDAALRLL
jgi:esterase/lipase superfamily enzyme